MTARQNHANDENEHWKKKHCTAYCGAHHTANSSTIAIEKLGAEKKKKPHATDATNKIRNKNALARARPTRSDGMNKKQLLETNMHLIIRVSITLCAPRERLKRDLF